MDMVPEILLGLDFDELGLLRIGYFLCACFFYLLRQIFAVMAYYKISHCNHARIALIFDESGKQDSWSLQGFMILFASDFKYCPAYL